MKALGSIAAGVLTLIVIQAFGSGQGPEQGSALMGWIASGVNRALNPSIAAIPTAAKAPPGKAPAAKPNPNEVSNTMPRNPSVWT